VLLNNEADCILLLSPHNSKVLLFLNRLVPVATLFLRDETRNKIVHAIVSPLSGKYIKNKKPYKHMLYNLQLTHYISHLVGLVVPSLYKQHMASFGRSLLDADAHRELLLYFFCLSQHLTIDQSCHAGRYLVMLQCLRTYK